MMIIKEFLESAFSAANPKNYEDFVGKKIKDVFKHFFLLLLFAILLFLVLNIPKVVLFPSNFQKELNKFDVFNITVNATTKETAHFWLFSIDTENNTEPETEGIMFSKNYLMIKYLPYLPAQKENISLYKNVLTSSSVYRNKVLLLLILLSPSILIAIYIYYAIKFLLIILISTILGFVISRIIRHEITFSVVFKIAIFSSLFLMTELILRVFISNIWIQQLIPFALFLIFFVIGIIKTGRKRKGYKEVGKKDIFEK